jgi:pyruvate/2-oxoacid:ferredoxin oxidoreductase alpha subunit
MASKGINVKIARTVLIDSLNKKLNTMHKNMQEYEKACEKYEKDKKKWEQDVIAYATSKGKITDAAVNMYPWRSESVNLANVSISYEFPKDKVSQEPEKPEKPYKSSGYGRNYTGGYEEQVAEISNAIRVLQLSNEETVSASTYGAVSKYL